MYTKLIKYEDTVGRCACTYLYNCNAKLKTDSFLAHSKSQKLGPTL